MNLHHLFRPVLFFALGASIARAAAPFVLSPAELPALAQKVPAVMAARIVTVVEKPQPSPSGDAHDYVSFARYYWPDPARPDGLPYVSRDGHHNREQVARGDHERLWTFANSVQVLAAGWALRHDAAAAQRAGEWLRAWFITPASRMNPNLNYAQVRLGHDHNQGSPYGVLDARCLAGVVDAIQLLEGSPGLSAPDEAAIRQWFTQYLAWLRNSKSGRAEHDARNNHGTWFLAQAMPIARFCGDDALARTWAEEAKARIAAQFKPDGAQPEEIRRVDGLGYSVFNLTAHFQVAHIARPLGVDLWNYVAPNGACLRQGLAFLARYNAEPSKWPTSQHQVLRPGFLNPLLTEAKAVWKEGVSLGDIVVPPTAESTPSAGE